MPAGKRMPGVRAVNNKKIKGNIKVETLLENPKKVTANNRRTGEQRKMTVRRVVKYLIPKKRQ